MTSPDRFSNATLFAGRLDVWGVSERGPWETRWIQFADERFTDHMLAQSPSDGKICTTEELAAAMAELPGIARARILRLSERLLDDVRRLWEQGRVL